MLPHLVAVKPAVGQHEHARLQGAEQAAGQFPLEGAEPGERRGDDGVRAPLSQAHHPDLGKRGVLPAARAAELGLVGGGIGHFQHKPINCHQPPPGQPGTRGRGPGHRHRHPVKKQPQRLRSQPLPRLADRPSGRHRPFGVPGTHELQPTDQPAHHLLIPFAEEKAQRENVINHYPGRKQPPALFPAARLSDHIIH